MTYLAGDVVAADRFTGRGTWTPTITATGGNPVLGATGYSTGSWTRIGDLVIVWIDINMEGSGVDFGGSSYRIGLDVAADTNFHEVGVLDEESHVVGSFQSRSNTGSQSLAGSVLLATSSTLILYGDESNSSVGSSNFTTDARIKIHAAYIAA